MFCSNTRDINKMEMDIRKATSNAKMGPSGEGSAVKRTESSSKTPPVKQPQPITTFKTPSPVKQTPPKEATTKSSVAKADPMKESYPDKVRRMTAIATKIKHYLEPAFSKSEITKLEYKTIMRKCVEKVYQESKKSPVRDESMKKLVVKYIEHYIKHRSS